MKECDIVSIDFGMEVDGYFADSAVTVPVGRIRPELQKLLDVTRDSLDRAIEKMRAGNRLGDVGHAVQSLVEENGFSVVREFVGHGIGTQMHDEPNLPNYGEPGRGAPASVTLDKLISWTDSPVEGVRHFSGTATSTTEFTSRYASCSVFR